MPKALTLAHGAATKTWTIANITIVPPALPGTVDGSAGWTLRVDTVIDGQPEPAQVISDSCSASAFHGLWDDIGTRIATGIAGGLTPRAAFYVALRDGLYHHSQREGGPIPSAAT